MHFSITIPVHNSITTYNEQRAKMYAEVKGWNVITVYRLDALSGKSIMDYNETKRMLKDIKDGTISGIIFSKLARLARNTKELLEISKFLNEKGYKTKRGGKRYYYSTIEYTLKAAKS